MVRWGKGVAAFAVIASIFAYGTQHKTPSTNQASTIAPTSTKQVIQNKSAEHADSDIPTKNVELKQVVATEVIPFQAITKHDVNLNKGESRVEVKGVNGQKKTTYRVTYVDGTETDRVKVFETIITQPITQVTKIGTFDMAANDGSGPAGATAMCTDGTLSYALHHTGACSKHGGVDIWYR
jgi:hypothetical protein